MLGESAETVMLTAAGAKVKLYWPSDWTPVQMMWYDVAEAEGYTENAALVLSVVGVPSSVGWGGTGAGDGGEGEGGAGAGDAPSGGGGDMGGDGGGEDARVEKFTLMVGLEPPTLDAVISHLHWGGVRLEQQQQHRQLSSPASAQPGRAPPASAAGLATPPPSLQ